MSYTIKPSIGMLPIDDLNKVMEKQGFIKNVSADLIKDVTAEKDAEGHIVTPGITDPTRIAVNSGERNPDGTIDRTTVRNALNLNGRKADDFLKIDDKKEFNASIDVIKQSYADEIKLLRDELYQLKSELVRTGHTEDTYVADGYIDGFRKSNIKYSEDHTTISAISGPNLSQSTSLFKKGDWTVLRKNSADIKNNILTSVTAETGNEIQLGAGTASVSINNSLLLKSLGEYNKGTFSFSKYAQGVVSPKENFTLLNDDSNMSRMAITKPSTGYAATLKIPNRCAGYLTKFTVNGRTVGNPGPLVCHLIRGNAEYIEQIASTAGLSKADADGTLLATSAVFNANMIAGDEITFDFTNTKYSPADTLSTPYPVVAGIDYCFVIEAQNVTEYDYWEIEFGQKRNTQADLQTNNKAYSFTNKDKISSTSKCFSEITNTDMLYKVTTRTIVAESEVPFNTGLYTTEKSIRIPAPIVSNRARLTLEVNKEGPFVTTTNATVQPNAGVIQFTKTDGANAEQAVIAGGDKIIIGSNICNVQTSTVNSVTIDRMLYVEPNMPIYRCGYKAQLRVCYVEPGKVSGVPTIQSTSEHIIPLTLVAVIPTGRDTDSAISDRLVFEADMEELNIERFNQVDLQISWNSALSPDIIQTQFEKGNDYIGRIHSMSLAFDKVLE